MESIPDSVSEKYSYGGCIWMALALHDRYGWPIYAQVEDDGTPDQYVAHAYVRHPNGTEVDVLGPQSSVDQFASTVRRMSRREFVGFVADTNRTEPADIEREYRSERRGADAVIDRYIEPRMIEAGMVAGTPSTRVAARYVEAKYDPYAPQLAQDVLHKHLYTMTVNDADDLNLDARRQPSQVAALMNRARNGSLDEFSAYMEKYAWVNRIDELRKSLEAEPIEYRIVVRGKVKGKGTTAERDLPRLREVIVEHYEYRKWADELEIVTRPRPKVDYRKLDALLAARAEREQSWAKLYADLRVPQATLVDHMTSSDVITVYAEDRGVVVGGINLTREDHTSDLSYTGCEADLRKLVAEHGDGPVWTVPKSTLWPEYRGKGTGIALYLRGIEIIRSKGHRPSYLEAHHCLQSGSNVFGSTSEDALRVWKKLAPRFPSSGTVIAIV
jgi:hypothetical protein